MKNFSIALLGVSILAGSAWADEITVGMTGPLSGPQAYFGSTWHDGFKLYVDSLNAKGGVNGTAVKYEQEDDKADPREGTLVAQKLCDDSKVVIGLVNFNSGVAQSSLPIYEECGLPTMNLASNPSLTKQGYKLMVRPFVNDTAGGKLPADYAVQKMGVKTAAVVNDKQVFGQGISEIFAKDFKANGGTVLSTSSINPTDVDFTAVLTEIKKQHPDSIYFGAVMPQLALFARQMREQGLTAHLMVPDGAFTPDFIDQAGEANVQGVLIGFQVPPLDVNQGFIAFSQAYKDKYGKDPGPYSIYGYSQGQILEQVLKDTSNHSRAAMAKALHAVKAKTIMGTLEFDETGELKAAPSYLYQVDGKAFRLIGSM